MLSKNVIKKCRQRKILSIFLMSFILFSCSKEENTGSTLDLKDVPSGEIVALELRDVTLTGYSSILAAKEQKNGTATVSTQKWWTHVVSDIKFNNSECGKEEKIKNMGFIAFSPNGNILQKTYKDGTYAKTGSWKWTNKDKKKITVTRSGESREFTITYLNKSNVVYASLQTKGNCIARTYEQFNAPF